MAIHKHIEKMLNEKIVRTKVIRMGQPIIKVTSDKKGFQYDPVLNKEVKMTPQEIKIKKKAIKKAVKTRKNQNSMLAKLRRKQSMKKRGSWTGQANIG
jgi:hypothetical protein